MNDAEKSWRAVSREFSKADLYVSQAVQSAAGQRRLNEEQAAVLAAVEGWSSPSTSQVALRCRHSPSMLSRLD